MEEGLKPCAHCGCRKYTPVAVAGRFIKPPKKVAPHADTTKKAVQHR